MNKNEIFINIIKKIEFKQKFTLFFKYYNILNILFYIR